MARVLVGDARHKLSYYDDAGNEVEEGEGELKELLGTASEDQALMIYMMKNLRDIHQVFHFLTLASGDTWSDLLGQFADTTTGWGKTLSLSITRGSASMYYPHVAWQDTGDVSVVFPHLDAPATFSEPERGDYASDEDYLDALQYWNAYQEYKLRARWLKSVLFHEFTHALTFIATELVHTNFALHGQLDYDIGYVRSAVTNDHTAWSEGLSNCFERLGAPDLLESLSLMLHGGGEDTIYARSSAIGGLDRYTLDDGDANTIPVYGDYSTMHNDWRIGRYVIACIGEGLYTALQDALPVAILTLDDTEEDYRDRARVDEVLDWITDSGNRTVFESLVWKPLRGLADSSNWTGGSSGSPDFTAMCEWIQANTWSSLSSDQQTAVNTAFGDGATGFFLWQFT